MNSNIRLIVLKNFEKRGSEISAILQTKYGSRELMIPLKQQRFSNGEGKAILGERKS